MERPGEMVVSVVTDGEILCVDKAAFTYISGAIPTGLAPDIVPQSAGGRVSIKGQGFLKHQQTRVRLCPTSGDHWKGDIHAHAEAATEHIIKAEASRVAKEREELRRFMADGGEIKDPDEEAWWKKKRRAARASGGSGAQGANSVPIVAPPGGNSSLGLAPPTRPTTAEAAAGLGSRSAVVKPRTIVVVKNGGEDSTTDALEVDATVLSTTEVVFKVHPNIPLDRLRVGLHAGGGGYVWVPVDLKLFTLKSIDLSAANTSGQTPLVLRGVEFPPTAISHGTKQQRALLKQMEVQLNAIEPETKAEADNLPFEVVRRIEELKAKLAKLEATAVDTPLTYVQMNLKEQDDAYDTAMAFMSEKDKLKNRALGKLPKHRGRLLHSYTYPARLVPATHYHYDIEFYNGDRELVPEINVRQPKAASKGSVKLNSPVQQGTALRETEAATNTAEKGDNDARRFPEGEVVEARYDGSDRGHAGRFCEGVIRKCYSGSPTADGAMVVQCVTQPVPQHLMDGVEALRMEVELSFTGREGPFTRNNLPVNCYRPVVVKRVQPEEQGVIVPGRTLDVIVDCENVPLDIGPFALTPQLRLRCQDSADKHHFERVVAHPKVLVVENLPDDDKGDDDSLTLSINSKQALQLDVPFFSQYASTQGMLRKVELVVQPPPGRRRQRVTMWAHSILPEHAKAERPDVNRGSSNGGVSEGSDPGSVLNSDFMGIGRMGGVGSGSGALVAPLNVGGLRRMTEEDEELVRREDDEDGGLGSRMTGLDKLAGIEGTDEQGNVNGLRQPVWRNGVNGPMERVRAERSPYLDDRILDHDMHTTEEQPGIADEQTLGDSEFNNFPDDFEEDERDDKKEMATAEQWRLKLNAVETQGGQGGGSVRNGPSALGGTDIVLSAGAVKRSAVGNPLAEADDATVEGSKAESKTFSQLKREEEEAHFGKPQLFTTRKPMPEPTDFMLNTCFFELSLNGKDWLARDRSPPVTLADPLRVSSISPAFGTVSGGTSVIIHGTAFVEGPCWVTFLMRNR